MLAELRLEQSGREDLNLRPHGPEPCALTGLRYAPAWAVTLSLAHRRAIVTGSGSLYYSLFSLYLQTQKGAISWGKVSERITLGTTSGPNWAFSLVICLISASWPAHNQPTHLLSNQYALYIGLLEARTQYVGSAMITCRNGSGCCLSPI